MVPFWDYHVVAHPSGGFFYGDNFHWRTGYGTHWCDQFGGVDLLFCFFHGSEQRACGFVGVEGDGCYFSQRLISFLSNRNSSAISSTVNPCW